MMPQAVRYDEFGTIDVLYLADVPDAEAGEGRVRIAVKAAGLNLFDMKARSGMVPFATPNFPRGIGSDFAGVVDQLGGGSSSSYHDGTPVRVGDEVLGWVDTGALRTQLVVAARRLARKPAPLSWEPAGSLASPGFTADAAITALGIGPGDTVLVSAAAGGVGTLYCQLARDRGATVIGTAGQRNHDFLRSLGVIPVLYGEGLADRVRAVAPDGITAVQDNFGRETIEAGLELGVPAARICSIADQAAVAELGVMSLGSYTRSAATLETLADDVATGKLALPVEHVFPLGQFADAFRLLESRHLRGKIAISLA